MGRISRHRYLMDNRPAPAQRKAEIENYHETVESVTAKHQQVLAEIKANTPTFHEKQIAYDKARGAYESRTFLESTLRMKGIDPAADIEDMKTQYEEWKRAFLEGEQSNHPNQRNTHVIGVHEASGYRLAEIDATP